MLASFALLGILWLIRIIFSISALLIWLFGSFAITTRHFTFSVQHFVKIFQASFACSKSLFQPLAHISSRPSVVTCALGNLTTSSITASSAPPPGINHSQKGEANQGHQ